MEQLSIFDLDEEQEKKVEALEKEVPKNEATQVVGLETIFDANIDNEVEDALNFDEQPFKEGDIVHADSLTSVVQLTTLKAGDQVKIKLIDEDVDSETHHYRKYYEPHVIGKVGEITRVIQKKNGSFTYEVNVYGTISFFEEQELVWIR